LIRGRVTQIIALGVHEYFLRMIQRFLRIRSGSRSLYWPYGGSWQAAVDQRVWVPSR